MSDPRQQDPELQKITQKFGNAKNLFLRSKGQFDGNLNDSINAMLDQIFQTTIAPIYQEKEQLTQRIRVMEKELKNGKPAKKELPKPELPAKVEKP